MLQQWHHVKDANSGFFFFFIQDIFYGRLIKGVGIICTGGHSNNGWYECCKVACEYTY